MEKSDLQIGAWYWIAGMGPMRVKAIPENPTHSIALTNPSGFAYHAGIEQFMRRQTQADLDGYRSNCLERGIKVPPMYDRQGMPPLFMPDVTSCEELFSVITEERGKVLPRLIEWEGIHGERESMKVGPYCMVSRRGEEGTFPSYQTMWVSPRDTILRAIERGTIVIPDTIHFEILVANNGWCLVTAQHSSIIGSVWLTERLRVETLPPFIKRTREND
jgi:hypothetical protein